MTSTRSRSPRVAIFAFLVLGVSGTASVAQVAAPTPIRIGGDVVVSTALRTRTYSWNWFGDSPNGEYVYQGTQWRFGMARSKPRYDWQVEFEVPLLLGLPETAVAAAPQGQLGLGAAYFAANGNSANPVGLFLKQGFVRINGLAGVGGQSLKIGRTEFNDGLEFTPKNATLAALNRDRISQRVIGNFGFSDVLRSLDGAEYALKRPTWNVTAIAARPTEGVFQVNGWSELSVNLFYASLTAQGGDRNPREWRVFALGYDDYRRGVLKTDNRPAAARTADTKSVAVGTYGGHYLQLAATPSGPIDLLAWGAVQAGSWGALSHRAGALALEIGWQPARLPQLRPWIRGGYDYSSGDGDPADAAHGTFFQVLPTARVYARTPFFNLMNTADAFGEAIVRPSNRLTLRGDVHSLRLAAKNDLWYSGGGAFQAATFGFNGRPSNGHEDLATLSDMSGDITLSPHVALGLYYGYAHGGALTRAVYATNDGLHLAFMEWLIRF